MKNKSDQPAVIILAAGKGKRMNNPDLPKVLALAAGKPLIHYVIEISLKLNPSAIIAVIGHHKELVSEYLELNFGNTVSTAVQYEQLGTGHAVKQAHAILSDFKGDVLILSGDVPLITIETLDKFTNHHKSHHSELSVLTSEATEPSGYGRIIRDEEGNFTRIIEEKDADDAIRSIKEFNSGIYLVKSDILFSALENVSNNNSQGEYYLTDIIGLTASQGGKVFAFKLAAFEELIGVNNPEQLREVEELLNSKFNN